MAEPHCIFKTCWSSNFDELPYFKSFDINGAILCMKVEVGLEKGNSCLDRTETTI